jgi:hypothetical protein
VLDDERTLAGEATAMWDVGAFAGVAKAAWAVLNWIRNSFDAPWKALLISARMHQHQDDWYEVNFKFTNEKPYRVNLGAVRTVRPKKLRLRRAMHPFSSVMVPASEGAEIARLGTVDARGAQIGAYEVKLFVKVPAGKKDFDVTFQFDIDSHDNRRTKFRAKVVTDKVDT